MLVYLFYVWDFFIKRVKGFYNYFYILKVDCGFFFDLLFINGFNYLVYLNFIMCVRKFFDILFIIVENEFCKNCICYF